MPKPSIDLANAVILLIDDQSGLFQTVCNMLTDGELHGFSSALAKMAKLSNFSIITIASVPQGPNGPMIFEIR
jgi:hypothetical protein